MPGLFPVVYGGGGSFPPIDDLPNADTPLVGDEFVPISQDGDDKKVTVDNLTVGRDVEMENLELTGGEITVPDPSGLSVNTDWFKVYKNSGVLNMEYLLSTGTPQTVFMKQLFNIGTGSGQFFHNVCTSISVNSAVAHYFTDESGTPDAGMTNYTFFGGSSALASFISEQGDTSNVTSADIFFSNSLHPIHALLRGRGTLASSSNVQSGDILGEYAFYGLGAGVTSNQKGAAIRAIVSGTPGEDDMPTDLLLMTSPDGTQVPTEKVRVTSEGNVGIGTSSPQSKLDVQNGVIRGVIGEDASIQNARFLTPVATITADTTLSSSHWGKKILFNPTSAAITITLPQQSTEATAAGTWFEFQNIGTYNVTFVKQGAESLSANTVTVPGGAGQVFRNTTTSWAIFAGTSVVNAPAMGTVVQDITTSQTKDFFCPQAPVTFLGIRRRCFSVGTPGTFKLQLNGVDITGLTGLVPSVTEAYTYATSPVNLYAGDVITVVADGTLATVVGMSLTPIYTVTY